MPPKARFTREQIINAALEIVTAQGADSLTARALGKRLESSVCTIFTVFESMQEVRHAVEEAAKVRYRAYVERGLASVPAFKGVGTQYILFAQQEPKLFQLLFMSERSDAPDIGSILPVIDDSFDKILASVTSDYGIGTAAAERLYRHLWIYTHGIASLCATKMCRFTDRQISELITEVCVSLLKSIKA